MNRAEHWKMINSRRPPYNPNLFLWLSEGRKQACNYDARWWKFRWIISPGAGNLIKAKWQGKAIKIESGGKVWLHISNCSNHGAWKQYTIVAWFRTGDDITTRQFIYEEGGSVNGLSIYIYDGKVWVGAWINIGGTTPKYSFLSYPVEPSREYVVANVFKGKSKHKLVVNGNIVAERDIDFNMNGHGDACCFGNMQNSTVVEGGVQNNNSLKYPFKGLLYGLYIWQYALTDAEAKTVARLCKLDNKPACITKQGEYELVRNTGIEVDGNMMRCAEAMV
ncbi:hypothetical protein DRP04_06385 [Archaeoglobales archaeon]|nr:MAG: hypothetical protein DRP04_06385 [Archaeoglobales archaeon]